MKPKLGLALMGAFMVVFPAAGLLYFWRDAHLRVERSGLAYVRTEVRAVLENWDKTKLAEDGTLALRQSDGPRRFEAAQAELGALRALGPWNVERVWAGSRDDMVWQFVRAKASAEYANGQATVVVTVARRTMAPEWRIENLRFNLAD
jgi:hypothetical protein